MEEFWFRLNSKHFFSNFWMLLGPSCLTLAFLILFFKAGNFSESPFWFLGLFFSIGISCVISCLLHRELIEQQENFKLIEASNVKELTSNKELLKETGVFYKEKVEKLELVIQNLEKEFNEIQIAYEKVYHGRESEHTRAEALQVSLHDALDAFREAQQFDFIKTEANVSLPSNLSGLYRQLRKQFDEKSLVLNQTRRRLFGIEGQLFVLQKVCAEEKLSNNSELDIFQKQFVCLEMENQQLQEEVRHLETLVSQLFETKSRKKLVAKKKVEQMLELQFDSTS